MTTDPLLQTTPLELFQTKSLSEIQDISKTLRATSITKHEEIRNLVGSKYRDLLISADEIKLMEVLAYEQDRKLYALIFDEEHENDEERSKAPQENDYFGNAVNGESLNRNNSAKIRKRRAEFNVNSNLELFLRSEVKEVKAVDDHVLQNSEFFIRLSKFLKINEDDSLKNIYNWVDELGYSWGSKGEVISEKFKEVEVIVQGKVGKIDDVEELSTLQQFVKKNDKVFDVKRFDELLFERIKELINFDDLKLVLLKFPGFQKGLEDEYENVITTGLQNLNKLISVLGVEGTGKLTLYELKFDDNYLTKIDYLSKGLIYQEYQVISDGFEKISQILQFMKVINQKKYSVLDSKYKDTLENFRSHAENEKNQLLIKYLKSSSS